MFVERFFTTEQTANYYQQVHGVANSRHRFRSLCGVEKHNELIYVVVLDVR